MSRRGSKTAGELMAELERKPEFVARQREWDAQEQENRRRYAEAAAGLLADLAAVGFEVSTMAELRQRGVGDRRAVPVLIEWLPRIEYPPLKRDVVATLASPWARPAAARPLIEEFNRIDPAEDDGIDSVRWRIGDALDRVADESVIDDLIEIAGRTEHGLHRAFVVAALGRMRNQKDRVVPVLVGLLDDEPVAGYAVMALGRLKASGVRSAVEPFLEHPDAWVRKEAKKALAKM